MNNTGLNKIDEYLDHVLTIKQFFNRHRSGGYMFAVSYSYALKKEVDREVIEYCEDQNLIIGEARIEFGTSRTCLQQLQEAKEEFKNGLILTNIDELMLFTHEEFAYQLNQMREALSSLHTPILIWLTPENHRAFTHKAIDLYTRRDLDTLFFLEIKTEYTNTDLYERSEMSLGQKEDSETLRTRIFLLEKQLEAARNDEIPQERIAKEIVFPLINAYRQLLLLEKAMNLVKEFKDEFRNDNREVFVEFGKLSYQSGNLDAAIDYFEKALEIDIMIFGEQSINVSFDYNQLGLTWKEKGDLNKAINFYEKALAICLKSFHYEDSIVAKLYNNIGGAWLEKGNLEKALDYLEKSLVIRLKLDATHAGIDTLYNNIATVWKQKGHLEKALDYYQKALEIGIKLYGNENPKIATRYNNIGLIWITKGNFDKAIEYFEKALSINLKVYGENSLNIAVLYNSLGSAWRNKGDLNKAIRYFENALNVVLKIDGIDGTKVTILYNNLGHALQDKGDLDKAINYYEKALETGLKLYGDQSPNIATYYNNIGGIWMEKGDLNNAINYFKRALDIDIKLYGENNPKVATIYNNLGGAWQKKGELDKAKLFYKKAYSIICKTYGEEHRYAKSLKNKITFSEKEENKDNQSISS